jgi:hypothetical protein
MFIWFNYLGSSLFQVRIGFGFRSGFCLVNVTDSMGDPVTPNRDAHVRRDPGEGGSRVTGPSEWIQRRAAVGAAPICMYYMVSLFFMVIACQGRERRCRHRKRPKGVVVNGKGQKASSSHWILRLNAIYSIIVFYSRNLYTIFRA